MPTTLIREKINEALVEARYICQTNGNNSQECAVAWEEVQELGKAINNKQKKKKNSLQEYCDNNPEAPECRIYD
ncbi:MAG: Calvin cycle protein CP12 [Prochloraceae cyanobacterium]